MKFIFISAPTFEPWDWTNPDTVGIGGSETSHIEMAHRLAARGHFVTSYAPTPGKEAEWRHVEPNGNLTYAPGVLWKHFSQTSDVQWDEPCDVWVVYRAPELIDHIPEGANIWLICQDVEYRALTPERAKRFTRLVGLCEAHRGYLERRYPDAKNAVCISSNGIKLEIIRKIAEDPPVRNPHRLMYASSPDRGMEFLLQIFPRAKEIVPDLELHLYYGFDNIEKVVSKLGEQHWISLNTKRLQSLIEQPGVVWHGRTGQPKLLREWFQAGIWCHPSTFTETSCITCMDAQACGAIPITSPIWAVAENVKHGVFIEGDVREELIRARFVNQLALMAINSDTQNEIRKDMMPWARKTFGWERWVDQWEKWSEVPGLAVEEVAA